MVRPPPIALTSKNFGPINFGHFISDIKFLDEIFENFGQFRTKFRTNFKSVRIFSDIHSYSRISFLYEYVPIEILLTERFRMEEVILRTRRFIVEGVLYIIRRYRLWVHMSGKQSEILLYVGGCTSEIIRYFCKNRMPVPEKLGYFSKVDV